MLALVEVALEAAGQDLVHRRGVVHGLGAVERGMRVVAPDDEPAVLGLARQAVLEDDHRRDDVGALDVADVEALDPQRRVGQLEGLLELLEGLAAGGEVAGPGHLVPGEGLLGVAADRLHQRPLVAALRDPQVHTMAAEGAEPGGQGLGLGGHDRDQDLARDLVGAVLGLVAVDLLEQVAHQLGDVLALLLDHPAALAADPAAAHEEHLDGRLELVVGEGEDVGVGLVGEDDRVASRAPCCRAPRSSRRRAASSYSCASDAARICRSTRLVNLVVLPAMKSQKSSAICRCSSGSPGRRTAPSTCRCSRAGTAGRSGGRA